MILAAETRPTVDANLSSAPFLLLNFYQSLHSAHASRTMLYVNFIPLPIIPFVSPKTFEDVAFFRAACLNLN